MKKLLIILFVFVLVFSGTNVFASDFNVVVDTKTATPGESVEINISFENNTGIIAALFNVEYDKERLELTGVEDARLLEGGTFSPNYKTYPYKMVWNSASYTNFTDSGVVATLTFRVLEDANPGKAYINLTYKDNDIFDVDLNNVKINVKNGGIDIENNIQSGNSVGNSSKPSSGNGSKPSAGGITVVQPMPQNNMKFTDIKEDDWYYNAVKFAFEKGITSGVSETSYAPHQNVTRGQFITMLLRAYNIYPMTGDNFSDCSNTWYTGYLAAAKQLGISNGVGDNKFAPENEITREQMVTLIYNYLKLSGKADGEYGNTTFADNDSVSDWAKSAVSFASGKGYIKGKDNNMFDPKGKATRAELAQIFYNILG